jgi:hypothetical protein
MKRPPDRRAGYDPDAACGYCGAPRRTHDRLAREWETCQAKAAWFAQRLTTTGAGAGR